MKPKLTPLNNDKGVRMSQTPAGQRELLREYRNKINELIDYITELEDRVRVLESNNNRGHR